MSAPECGYTWCDNTLPGHREHAWTQGVIRTPEGTSRVYLWTSARVSPARICIAGGDDDFLADQVWLSLEGAEHLRDALTTAIDNARSEFGPVAVTATATSSKRKAALDAR